MDLRLNDEEARPLLLLLDRAYGEIKYQISDADDSRFSAQLRQEKAIIEGIMQRLREQGVEPASVAFPPAESHPAASA
jgi:hypothetical protein